MEVQLITQVMKIQVSADNSNNPLGPTISHNNHPNGVVQYKAQQVVNNSNHLLEDLELCQQVASLRHLDK